MPWEKANISTSWDTSLGFQSALEFMWSRRNDLNLFERRGLANVAYISMCASFESTLARAIDVRISTAVRILKKDGLSPTTVSKDGKVSAPHSSDALVDSLAKVAQQVVDRNDQLKSLSESYSNIFGKSLTQALGSELEKDLKAVYKLRNIIAHGRNFKMDKEYEFLREGKQGYSSDSREGQLQAVFSRLEAAKLLPPKPYEGLLDFLNDFCVLKYFRDRMVAAMEEIYEQLDIPYEKLMWGHRWPYPKLEL